MRGAIHRDRFGKVAQLQPAAAALQSVVAAIAAEQLPPESLRGGGGQDAGADGYRSLLRLTLESFSCSAADDARALRIGEDSLPPRHRLALEFRLQQKRALQVLIAGS